MSNLNEEEKLTLGSWKGYDKSSTTMSENDHEFEASEERDDEETDTPETEDGERAEKENQTKEKQGKLVKLLSAIFATAHTENNEDQQHAIAEAIIRFASSDETSEHETKDEWRERVKSEQDTEKVAKLLLIFASPQQLDHDSSNADVEEATVAVTIFNELLDSVEEAGFDKEVVSEKIAELAEDQPPIEENRFEKLDEYLKKQVEDASDNALKQLNEALVELKEIADAGSEIEEYTKEATTVLDDILTEVEVHHNTIEDHAQERDLHKEFAEIIVHVFGEEAAAALKPEPPEEGVTLNEQEEKEAQLLMDLLLTGDTPPKIKHQLAAALLDHFPTDSEKVDAKTAHRNGAIRKKLLDYAERAGLSREDIMTAEYPPAAEEGELSAFEQLVAEQIEHASIDSVQEIQKVWRNILENVPPGSQLAIQAQDAIDVLGDIIQLREMQDARDKGEIVDFSKLRRPFNVESDEVEEEIVEEVRAEKKKDLAKLLAEIFRSAQPLRSEEERGVIASLTNLVLASKHTKEEKQELLSAIVTCFPMIGTSEAQHQLSALHGYFSEYAFQNGLDFPDVPATEPVPADSLERLLQETLKETKDKDLGTMKLELEPLLTSENLPLVTQRQLKNAIGMIDPIIDNKPARDVLQRPVEQPDTVTGKRGEKAKGEDQERFTQDLLELVRQIDPDGKIKSDEGVTVDILLGIIAHPNQHTKADKENFTAEKKIAEVLAAFNGHDLQQKLAKKVAAASYDLELDTEVLNKEKVRLIDSQDQDPFIKLEQLVSEHVERLSPQDRTKIKAQFSTLLTKIDSDSPVRATAQEAMALFSSQAEAEKSASEVGGVLSQKELSELTRARRTIRALKERYDASPKLAELDDYIDSLTGELQSLSPSQMENALDTLNEKVQLVTGDIKSQITNDDESTSMKGKIETLRLLETSMDEYRMFFIRQINKDKTNFPEGVAEVLSDDVDLLNAETIAINELPASQTLTPLRFATYVINLQKALDNPWLLTKEQLEGAYSVLITQQAIIQNNLISNANFLESVELSEKVRDVQMKLYEQLVIAEKNAILEIEDSLEAAAAEKVKTHAERSGDVYYNSTTDVYTRAPVKVPDQYSRGFATGYIEEDVASELLTSAQTFSSSIPGDATPAERQMREQFGRERMQQIYTAEAALVSDAERLQEMLSSAIRDNTSESMLSLKAQGDARALATAMMRQRNELAKLRGYEGLIQKKSEMDEALFEGYIHDVLNERMRRIRVYFRQEPPKTPEEGQAQESYTEADIKRYYKELQRWAKILIKNDFRNKPEDTDNPDVLKLRNDQFERFKKIADTDIENISAQRSEILESIDYMLDEDRGNFLRYFKQNAPDPKNAGELLGVYYQRPEDMGPYSPEALGATMQTIAKEYGADFQTGGKHELMNAEGEFQYHNFLYWIRMKINEDVLYNKDGQINPFGKIIIKLDMGQISMYELLLLIPEYTAQREFEIRMNDGNSNEVYSGWGDKKEDPDFGWGDLDLIAAEMEFRQMTHEIRTQFIPTSVSNNKEQYIGLMKKLHHNNHWSRASNIFLLLGLPSSNTNGKQEIDDWAKNEQQGSLGKAMSDMLVSYYYLSEMTDYHKIVGTEREKNFNENMFYRFLEPEGANRFLLKMAEGALAYNADAKKAYAQFIGDRIDAAAAQYLRDNPDLDDKALGLLTQLKDTRSPHKNGKSPEINFTASSDLADFRRQVETQVLGKKIDDKREKELILEIRDDLVDNLKSGYFDKLKGMKVKKISGKGSNRHLKTSGEISFGEIELEGGMTMGQLLDGFDPQQILRFDYSNNPNDPTYKDNPFTVYKKDEDLLRFKIDEFMDPSRNPENHALFRRNEKMMLAFTKHITRIDRKDLNHFRDADELVASRDLIQRAFKNVFERAYGIDDVESTYAWWWVRDYVYLWGIGASLDCDGIGFRWDGKIQNPGKWRPRRQGKDGGGNPHTFDEFRSFTLPFLHHLRVSNLAQDEPLGHRSVFSWLQGGEGGYITPRALRKFDTLSNYHFEQNAEALFVDNTVENSSELLELLAKTEFDVSSIVSFDVLGNVVYDYGKAREVFGKWRKAARYAFGKNGLDYREKIWANGREKTLYDHFFGPKTRALNELIYRETKDQNKNRTIDFMYKDPADAIMMSIVAAEVAEHRAAFSSGHHWSIQNVLELERFLLDFMTESSQKEDEEGEIESKPKIGTLFNHKIFAGALKAYHTSYSKMYRIELGSSIGGGFLEGILAGVKATLTKGKWIY